MSDDEDFTPRLGKPRAAGGKGKARRYLGVVVGAAARAGAVPGNRSERFDGSRIGRGASIGRVLSARDRLGAYRSRRVVAKMSYKKLGTNGLVAARVHLQYLQRGGVSREGGPGQLYSAGGDEADGRSFLERSAGDARQFRFIVSAEDGNQYADLKPLTRRLMEQMEWDLGTKLDWVAVDHHDTGHPHTHIVLRGRDDLVIAREYVRHGLRQRAIDLVNRDLGPRTTLEIEERLRHDIGAQRVTAIDRRMIREMDDDREIGQSMRDPFQQALRVGRLRVLEGMGLADEIGGGRWRLAAGLEDTLRRVGERGDVIRTMQRELTARNCVGREQHIFDPAEDSPLVGRVIGRGLADELRDRHFLLVDGVDGRHHYIDIGRGDKDGPTPEGSIVRIGTARSGIRDVDRTVAEIAVANGWRYSIDLHLRHDASASEAFAEAHVRRLEAVRRATGGVQRRPDGSWDIAPDHLDRIVHYEAQLARARPVVVETISPVPVERLVAVEAATWLDRRIAGQQVLHIHDAGFGREVLQAEGRRRRWLVEQELAEEQQAGIRLRANALTLLRRRELLRVAGQLSDELGLVFVETKPGGRIAGTLKRQVDLLGGQYALIEKSQEFTLVPWRPLLERQLGKPIAGIMRSDGMGWTFGRGRGGPTL